MEKFLRVVAAFVVVFAVIGVTAWWFYGGGKYTCAGWTMTECVLHVTGFAPKVELPSAAEQKLDAEYDKMIAACRDAELRARSKRADQICTNQGL